MYTLLFKEGTVGELYANCVQCTQTVAEFRATYLGFGANGAGFRAHAENLAAWSLWKRGSWPSSPPTLIQIDNKTFCSVKDYVIQTTNYQLKVNRRDEPMYVLFIILVCFGGIH